MRVTFVVGGFTLAGGARVVLMLAQRLMRPGHKVVVVGPQVRRRDVGRARVLLRCQGWLTSRTNLSYVRELGPQVERRLLYRHRPVEDRDLPHADVVVQTWWQTA